MGNKPSSEMPKTKKPTVSKTTKAGLIFPVSRVNRHMKENHTKGKVKRVGQLAPVFTAAVLEYIASEIFECSGNTTIAAKRKRISLADVCTTMRSDPELYKLMRGNVVFTGERLTGVTAAVTMAVPKAKPKQAEEAAAAEPSKKKR